MARYVLIDYMHLAHRCFSAEPLSTTVKIDGDMRVVDTTIPNYTIKNIFRYSGQGRFYTGVFFEGGSSERKKYFAESSEEGYKGNREKRRGSFYKGADLSMQLLYNGKVSIYRYTGLEADDCIYSVVKKIQAVDKVTPIDIITNDSDLLPLVDDQVSVFMRGTRQYAEDGAPERRLYYQVTPNSWQDFVEYASAYKGFYIPYNSMLLFKLIRGDKSDNVPPAIRGYGRKKFTALMLRMEDDGVDFQNTFRYGVDFDEVIAPVLSNYFKPDEIERMKFIYNGIGLKYVNLVVPKQIELGTLQAALIPLKINLVK